MKKTPTSGHDTSRSSEAMSNTLITRRRLLGALGAPLIIASAALGRRAPPSDRIVILDKTVNPDDLIKVLHLESRQA